MRRRILESLVVANFVARPTRALGSVLGVALGVVLIVVTIGLARGMLRSTGEREANVGAELIFQAPGGFGAGAVATPLALPVAYTEALAEIPGVSATTPVGRYLRSGAKGIGFELIEGVVFESERDHASYPGITGIRPVRGRLPASDFELVVDRQRSEDYGTDVGDVLNLLGHDFVVSGIFEPEVGARIKMPLETLQRLLGASGKCSWILVKTTEPEAQESVAFSIEEQFPGNQIIFTRDIPGFYDRGMPSLTIFLNVVVGLATAVSGLVILLAMYTSVTERTREIGILKSLGASRWFIVSEVEKEAILISFLGVVAGIGISALTRLGIIESTSLVVDFELQGLLVATVVAVTAGVVGSLYPAVKAARQDPVQALSYE